MAASILVAYATRYGSTQEVAEAVGAALRQHTLSGAVPEGLHVEVRPAREVRDLTVRAGAGAGDRYSAVVIGAALYCGSWHGDALDFLARHRDALSRLPVAVFALGPLSNREEELGEARAQLDNTLAKEPWFRPVSSAVFAGKFDPRKLRFVGSLLSLPIGPLKNIPARDARDWAAIRAWAEGMAEALLVTSPVA